MLRGAAAACCLWFAAWIFCSQVSGSQGTQVVECQGRDCAVQMACLQQKLVFIYLWLQLLTDLHHHNRQSQGDSSGAEALLPVMLLGVVCQGQVCS
jgi:hypothetical protein